MTSSSGANYWQDQVNGANNVQGYICEWDKVTMNTSKTVYYGESATLKVYNTSKKVTWSTSNKDIATVSSNGKVTAKSLGKCTIYAKVGSKTLKCKLTVKDKNQKAALKFTASDGGYFIKGVNTATIKFAPKSYNCGKATVYVKDATGEIVYKKICTNLTKGKAVYVTWNGKNSSGKYVAAGSYKAVVKIGSKSTGSAYITFYDKNDFAGGSGAKSNPFLVATTAQLKKIVKYPNACFKQTKDLDFGYNAVGNFFTQDQPFNGRYNGNGKTIKNTSSSYALFECIGEKGVVYNLKMKNCNVVADGQALLVKNNYGTIKNCNINGVVTVNDYTENSNANIGLMVCTNYGTITNCTTSGTVKAYDANGTGIAYAGGIAEYNTTSGKIISCISHTDVTGHGGHYNGGCAGGIVATNSGLINGCEADGKVSAIKIDLSVAKQGGISGNNAGQIMSSYYTGTSSVNIAGYNTGVIA